MYFIDSGRKALRRKALQEKSHTLFGARGESPTLIFQTMEKKPYTSFPDRSVQCRAFLKGARIERSRGPTFGVQGSLGELPFAPTPHPPKMEPVQNYPISPFNFRWCSINFSSEKSASSPWRFDLIEKLNWTVQGHPGTIPQHCCM